VEAAARQKMKRYLLGRSQVLADVFVGVPAVAAV
jgi:hypothetical protein